MNIHVAKFYVYPEFVEVERREGNVEVGDKILIDQFKVIFVTERL